MSDKSKGEGAKGAARANGKNDSRKIDVKLQESPVERALKLSSEQVIAMAIRDMIIKDRMN